MRSDLTKPILARWNQINLPLEHSYLYGMMPSGRCASRAIIDRGNRKYFVRTDAVWLFPSFTVSNTAGDQINTFAAKTAFELQLSQKHALTRSTHVKLIALLAEEFPAGAFVPLLLLRARRVLARNRHPATIATGLARRKSYVNGF